MPNALFYDGDLTAHADEVMRAAFCHWSELPAAGVPIIFHGIKGLDEREARSPSWFNADEASQVEEYVQKILASRGTGISTKDIGIITPYRQQMSKIRQLLRAKNVKNSKFNLEEIQVGTVSFRFPFIVRSLIYFYRWNSFRAKKSL